jgi:hypothetical protein
MKVIAFEEHYKLPAISQEHQNEGLTSEMDLLKQALRPGRRARRVASRHQ